MGTVISHYQKQISTKKGFINIQSINDNECFKWCVVRYLHLADDHPV